MLIVGLMSGIVLLVVWIVILFDGASGARKTLVAVLTVISIFLVVADIAMSKNNVWQLSSTEITNRVDNFVFHEPVLVEYWVYDDGIGISLARTGFKRIIKEWEPELR